MRNVLIISMMVGCLVLAGCRHNKQAVTPAVQAPLPEETEPPQAAAPPPELKLPTPAPTPPPVQATTTPEPPRHHKVKPSPATPAESAPAAGAPAPQQQTASVPAPAGGASAIGQLSEGGPAASNDLRNQTVDMISSVERRLKEISRPLTGQEQRTAGQVRKFLQQANDALRNQDVDAAHTLATKANVLLEELLK